MMATMNASGNGLMPEETDQALALISKLKLHDLSAIIQSCNLRKPRAGKAEAAKVVQQAIFDPNKSRTVFQMMFQFQAGNYDMSRQGRSQPRNHPYVVPAQRGAPNNMMPNPMNFVQHLHLQHFQQQMTTHQAMTPQHSRRTYAPSFEIVPLPFYDVIATLMQPLELHAGSDGMKANKNLQFQFQLTPEQMSKLQYPQHTNPILPRYEVQLRFFNITELNGPQKDEFPLNAVVRTDDSSVPLPNVIPTNKPNVEPKRPSRPVNITPQLRISAYHTQMNHRVQVDWTSDRRTWAVMVCFVHRVDSQILYDRVNGTESKHKGIELTKREVRDKLTGSGEEDIAMDALKICLLDPLVKTRMVTPARCIDCTHLQCFDLMSYLMMNEKKPTWQCPVCSAYCPYDRLIVDDYFMDLLKNVDKSTTEVELKPDGSYDIIGRDDEVCLSDDDDDDVKPVTTNHVSSSNGSGATTNGAACTSSTSTEQPTNGGKKRKAPADEEIITLSDDDDDDDDLLSQGMAKAPQTPPQQARPAPIVTNNNKKSKSTDIEVITLDDTPPRPVAQQPVRQMSQQTPIHHLVNHPMQPTSSSSASSMMAAHATNLNDALAQIGSSSSGSSSRMQQQPPPPPHQHQHQPQAVPPATIQCAMNNASAASSAMPSFSQYGYHPVQMMQQPYRYTMQNGLIGRSNQMVGEGGGQPMNPQQQQQPNNQMLSSQNYYGQQNMGNGVTRQHLGQRAMAPPPPPPPPAPAAPSSLPARAHHRHALNSPPGVTQRKHASGGSTTTTSSRR